jgi:hypothetical protein
MAYIDELKQKIAAGIKFLDENKPGWYKLINVNILDMNLPNKCIAGQLGYGDMSRGHEYGFWFKTDNGVSIAEFGKLWIEQINLKLESETVMSNVYGTYQCATPGEKTLLEMMLRSSNRKVSTNHRDSLLLAFNGDKGDFIVYAGNSKFTYVPLSLLEMTDAIVTGKIPTKEIPFDEKIGEYAVSIIPNIGVKVGCTTVSGDTVNKIAKAYNSAGKTKKRVKFEEIKNGQEFKYGTYTYYKIDPKCNFARDLDNPAYRNDDGALCSFSAGVTLFEIEV